MFTYTCNGWCCVFVLLFVDNVQQWQKYNKSGKLTYTTTTVKYSIVSVVTQCFVVTHNALWEQTYTTTTIKYCFHCYTMLCHNDSVLSNEININYCITMT